jgi:hypothetical protein
MRERVMETHEKRCTHPPHASRHVSTGSLQAPQEEAACLSASRLCSSFWRLHANNIAAPEQRAYVAILMMRSGWHRPRRQHAMSAEMFQFHCSRHSRIPHKIVSRLSTPTSEMDEPRRSLRLAASRPKLIPFLLARCTAYVQAFPCNAKVRSRLHVK